MGVPHWSILGPRIVHEINHPMPFKGLQDLQPEAIPPIEDFPRP